MLSSEVTALRNCSTHNAHMRTIYIPFVQTPSLCSLILRLALHHSGNLPTATTASTPNTTVSLPGNIRNSTAFWTAGPRNIPFTHDHVVGWQVGTSRHSDIYRDRGCAGYCNLAEDSGRESLLSQSTVRSKFFFSFSYHLPSCSRLSMSHPPLTTLKQLSAKVSVRTPDRDQPGDSQ